MAVSIVDEKKIIIHNILRAIVITGLALNIVTSVRDIYAGLPVSNMIVNTIALALMALLWVFSRHLDLRFKTWALILVTGFVGSKVILVNGVIAGSFYFFIIGSLIGLLMFESRHAMWLIVALSLLYFVLITLMAFDVLQPTIPPEGIEPRIKWIAELCSYALVLFIVIGGVGRLQRVFVKSITELDETNQKLNQSNEELTNQLDYVRTMQRKVEQTEFNFQRLFQESSDGILLCNGDRVILESNNSLSTMLDYPRSFLVGSDAADYVSADDKRIISQLSIEKVHQSKLREINLVSRGGVRIPVEIHYRPIQINDGPVLLVTIRDIRERKLAEQELLNAVIQAEENERSRFATDLHDDLGPILSSIKMYIQSLRTHEDSDDKKELVNRLIGTVDDSIKSIRRISYNLSSHLLQNMGLINAIQTHVDRLNLTNTLKTKLTHDFPEAHRLNSNVEIVVYRVVLELITNSFRHSQGSAIGIDLQLHENRLLLNYSDNGIGFDIDRMLHDNTKGIGLKNILSRVRSIKGVLNFETQRPGFNVSIDIAL